MNDLDRRFERWVSDARPQTSKALDFANVVAHLENLVDGTDDYEVVIERMYEQNAHLGQPIITWLHAMTPHLDGVSLELFSDIGETWLIFEHDFRFRLPKVLHKIHAEAL
jgi:hypothetical protein